MTLFGINGSGRFDTRFQSIKLRWMALTHVGGFGASRRINNLVQFASGLLATFRNRHSLR